MATDPASHEAPDGIETRGNLTLADYWHERVALHHEGSYAGIAMLKFPEDLSMYQALIWSSGPETILELGCQDGGSTLWLRDQMETASKYGGSPPRIVAVDIDISRAERNLDSVDPAFRESITLIQGSILEEETVAATREAVGEAPCLVIEDSAHTYETTSAALNSFADLVPEGGFFVVEDGYVDVEWMRPSEDWPRGVQPAIEEWLAARGRGFVRRRDLEVYGFTCHPGGILQRRDATSKERDDAQRTRVADPEDMTGYRSALARLEKRTREAESYALEAGAAKLSAEQERDLAIKSLEQTEAHLARANAAIAEIKNSASWRITQPLRKLKNFGR